MRWKRAAPVPPFPGPRRIQHGLTLLELAVAMVIACVGIGVGLPSYQHFVQQNRTDTLRHLLISHFASARLTAATHRKATVVCPSDGIEAGCRTDGDWSRGWMMFFDPDIKTTLILLILQCLYSSHDRTYSLSYSSFWLAWGWVLRIGLTP